MSYCVGKINVSNANVMSLRKANQYGFDENAKSFEGNGKSLESSDSLSDLLHEYPALVIQSGKSISVESLSWLERIKRKHLES